MAARRVQSAKVFSRNCACLKMLSLSRPLRPPSALSHTGTAPDNLGDKPAARNFCNATRGEDRRARPGQTRQSQPASRGKPRGHKKRKTELQTRERKQFGLNLTIIRSEDRKDPRKLLASFRSDRQVSAELHGSSFFTAASTESNGHDSGSENDSALHSISPDSVPEKSGRD